MLGPGSAEDLTVEAYLASWLEHAKGRVRATTYEGYEALVRRHAVPRIGSLLLRDLRPLHLQHLYGSLLAEDNGIAAGTVLNLHLALTNALSRAVRWGLLQANPAAGAQPPRPRRPEPVVVTTEVVERLLTALRGTRFEVSAAIAVATGMRRGEILALRWSDLDEGWEVAQVLRSLQPTTKGLVFEAPKTRRSRRAVALPAFLRPYLEAQRRDQDARRARLGERWRDLDLVIDSGNGSPLNPDTLSSAWSRTLRLRGLPRVRFHDLRHGHATLMLLKGIHPKIVSERLGHASVGITLDTYSHVLPSMQGEAAKAFDELFAS